MKRIAITVFGLFIAFNLLAPVAYAQQPGLDVIGIASSLKRQDFWIVLLATTISGAVGGVVYELVMLQGNLELPHKPTEKEISEKYPYAIVQNLYDLGIWARIIIGALAAVAALLVLQPSDTFPLLATAVVAGSAGIAVFNSVEDRLLATLAQKDAADVIAAAARQTAKLEDVRDELTKMRDLGTREEIVAALGHVDRMLSEALGMQEGIHETRAVPSREEPALVEG